LYVIDLSDIRSRTYHSTAWVGAYDDVYVACVIPSEKNRFLKIK